jgi:hypothetical protein
MTEKIRDLYFIFVFILLSFLSSCAAPSPRTFNSEEWKSGGSSVRGSMVPDLIDRRLLEDKSKADVEQLLGKADSENLLSLDYKVITFQDVIFGFVEWKYLLMSKAI